MSYFMARVAGSAERPMRYLRSHLPSARHWSAHRRRWRGRLRLRDRPPIYGRRSLPIAVVPFFVAAAILGYAAGHSHSKSVTGDAGRTAASSHVLLEYPPGWKPASGGAQIPNLTVASAQLLAPHGEAARAGLIVGTLAPSGLGPLPGAFVSALRRLPATAVVDLVETQAYRYQQLSVPGFSRALTIFVIPSAEGDSTALVCYAPSPASPYMHACEQTVSGVAVVGQAQSYQLTPEAAYAAKISAAVVALDRLRVALKSELRPQVTAEQAQQVATRLRGGFAAAGASLSKLEPTFAARRVQAALSSAIQRADAGYADLAQAAAERSVADYTAAQKRVSQAESDVDLALESFALIGYGPAFGGQATAHG
jgi:hypothetical protein